MNRKAFRTLEFSKIIQMLISCAASDMGKAAAEGLEPSADIEEIRRSQKETSEALSMIIKKGSLGLGGLRDIKPYIKRVDVSGSLNIEELMHIGDFLRESRRAKDYGQSEGKNDIRYMVGIPIPKQGTAYIYVLQSEFVIELIGKAILVPKSNEE